MKNRKDINGEVIHVGDIMAECTGGSSLNGIWKDSLTLWEVPTTTDGSGLHHNISGEKSSFWWASPSQSVRLDPALLPKGFLYAVRHGLNHLDIEEHSFPENIYTAIASSGWEKNAVTPSIVAQYKKISKLKITCFTDIYNNWEALTSCKYTPGIIVEQILRCVSYRGSAPINGEIGLSLLQDHGAFLGVWMQFREWKEKGILKEKCEEYDRKHMSKE